MTIEERMKIHAEARTKGANYEYKMYRFKHLSTHYLIFYPIIILYYYTEKLILKWQKRYKWDEARTRRIIEEDIVRHGELVNNEISYYYRTWSHHWDSKYHSRWINRGFCRKFGEQITNYFKNEFQIEGYTKVLDTSDSDWIQIYFIKNIE